MKKINSSKKLSFKFVNGGEYPVGYLEWLQETRGIAANPDDEGNLNDFNSTVNFKQPQQLPNNYKGPNNDVRPPSIFAINSAAPKAPTTFGEVAVPEGQMSPEKNGLKSSKGVTNQQMRNAYLGLNLLGAGINNAQERQAQRNEREYNMFMNKPMTYVNPYQEGQNRNSENLSVSDTALTRNGALITKYDMGGGMSMPGVNGTIIANMLAKKKYAMGGMSEQTPAELEGNEAFTTPDGITTQLNNEPKHEQGGWQAEYNGKPGLPVGTKVYSDNDEMKPSQMIDTKKFSDLLGVKLKGSMTYADIVKKIDDKYSVAKNTEILQSKRYDTQFKQGAQAMINKANVLKEEVVFPLQQAHNGNSNGQEKLEPIDDEAFASYGAMITSMSGGGIHIKPENKGKFTSWAKSHGMGVQEAAKHVMANKEDYSSTIVKRANFAKNAAGWKHENGGVQMVPGLADIMRLGGMADNNNALGFISSSYDHGGEVFENNEFEGGGYTVKRSHDRKGKTHVVIGPDGTKKYFGDSHLGQHPDDPARKKAFYARHKHNLDNNPYFRAFARKTWEDGGMMYDVGGTPPSYQPTSQADYEYRTKMYNDSNALANKYNQEFWNSKDEVVKNIDYYNNNTSVFNTIGNFLNGTPTQLTYNEQFRPNINKLKEDNGINYDIAPIGDKMFGNLTGLPKEYHVLGLGSGMFNNSTTGSLNDAATKQARRGSFNSTSVYQPASQQILPFKNANKNLNKTTATATPASKPFVPDPKVIEKQKLIGVTPDGIWGPKSEAAWKNYTTNQANPVPITPTFQSAVNQVVEPTKKIMPVGTIRLSGREVPYSSQEEFEMLKNNLQKYGKLKDVGDVSATKTHDFVGTNFKGWNSKNELVDKAGNIVYSPSNKPTPKPTVTTNRNGGMMYKNGGMNFKKGQEIDLTPAQIKDLESRGYKLQY